MFEKRIQKFISDYIRSNHSKITVKAGKCRYNFQCHSNATHTSFKKGYEEMALVVYFDGDDPIVHFININKKGKYVDNTLGIWSQVYEYYLIRHIPKIEFWDVYKIHKSYRKYIKSLLPFYLRIFHDYRSI